jgi:SAM-dependent methyltransferase
VEAARPTTLTRFDLWARTYNDSPLRSLYEAAHLATLRAARASGRPVTRILDIGCGTGRFIHRCRAAFPSAVLVGLDSSRAMLAVARETMPTTAWVWGTAEALPFNDRTFDLVVAVFSVRHWPDPLRGATEIARVMRTSGVLIVTDADVRRGIQSPTRGQSGILDDRDLWQAGLSCSTRHEAAGYGPVQVVTVLSASPACLRRRWHRHHRYTGPMASSPYDKRLVSSVAAPPAPFSPPRYRLTVSPLSRA